MNPMVQKLLFGLGTSVWGGLTFLVGLYATFPADTARDRVVYEFGEWSRGEYALGIGDLALWRLSGLDLEDVTFYTVKKGRKSKDDPEPQATRQPMLHLDGLAVRAAPLSMLMGKDAMAFVAEISGGALDGEMSQSEAGMSVSFDGGGIDLGRLPIATDQMTLNLVGIASGEADLSFDSNDPKNSTGFLNLSFEGLGVGPQSAVAGFGLPEVTFSKAAVAFEVNDGKLSVTEGAFESDLLNATLSGDITLNKKFARSRNRLELVFSLPADLDQLAQISPDLKRSRDADGKYHLNIGGTILAPSVRFQRAGGIGRAGKMPGDGGNFGGDDGMDMQRPQLQGDVSEDAEARRIAREERIRERRERLRERREAAGTTGGALPRGDRDMNDRDMGDRNMGDRNQGNDDFEPGMNGENSNTRRMPQQFPPDGAVTNPLTDPDYNPANDPSLDHGDLPMDEELPSEFEE